MVLAIVTGAAKGIGRSAALQLSQDGFEVAVIDLPDKEKEAQSVVAEIKKAGGNAAFYTADVSKKAQFEKAVQTAIAQFGTLDVLVNNAGISIMAPIELITEEDFSNMFNVNIMSVVYGMQIAIAEFKKTKHKGKIINAASSLSHQGMPTVGAYASSKACIKSLTQTAAKEFADLGIMVNCYCPGPIRTDLFEGIVDRSVELGIATAQEVEDVQRNGMLLKKFGTTEEIADIISFLASPRRKWITGQSYTADGGLNFT
ncbi:hypothetical protein FT663_01890 [Candidozyma haemuli var. vulneris]|uniref:Diacetyl reductase [(S)-acetoin forming] n=1 Tax=Candidozyma haemuli TaxID=45357 RepID=A0A2V1AS29_9ASCO|nr:hypothetical protein CXQ85_004545 [[Candida] haemuloni]KAF3990877.1 hypothetical protein FT662_02039 [[Candida] haemuloni var. vulneris]KAF3993386.1 hypothetical protein FT663_01890 [[Candida] haemuloni var. vulneris]PVH21027.1 hypothetical protein CXQ85_004545 [[Candida] haemuloni]